MLTMKPTKRTIAHTDATEHAYDDNTGPRGSDATERAATTPTHTPAAGDIEEPLMPSQLPSKKLCRAATSRPTPSHTDTPQHPTIADTNRGRVVDVD